MNIYSDLFDLMKDNLDTSGNHIDYQAESFAVSLQSDPVYLDMDRAEKLTGRAYLDAVWFMLFQKLPSGTVIAECQGKSNAEILQKAVNEPAFAIRQLRLRHNIHPVKQGWKSRIYARMSCIRNSVFLRKLAKKMPKGIQSRIRGIYS